MLRNWSPYPRYRLYTTRASYLPRFHSKNDAIQNFEDEVCRRFQIPAAVAVPMARVGIYLALLETIRPGETVIMSPLTIVDVINAVLLAGGTPSFADISRETCALDPAQAEALIDGRTGAVLITHLHGQSAGARIFREICDRRGIPLIEDCAQAFAPWKGIDASDVSVTSGSIVSASIKTCQPGVAEWWFRTIVN